MQFKNDNYNILSLRIIETDKGQDLIEFEQASKHYVKDEITNQGKKDVPITNESEGKPKKAEIKDLFHPKLMALRTANMFYQWFSVTLVYYGLSYSSTDLAGDPYTNFCLSVAVEIPGIIDNFSKKYIVNNLIKHDILEYLVVTFFYSQVYSMILLIFFPYICHAIGYLFGLFVMECWGRRPILTFCQIVSGICCVIAGLLFEAIDENSSNDPGIIIQIFLALIGKMLASATFQIIHIYTAEIYPTTIRYH